MSTGVLHQFYNSTAWKKLRKQYLDDHFWRCEVSGEYADTVHHIRPLNEDNFTDPFISLNPNNLICVSRTVHDLIHQRYQSQRREIQYDSQGNIVAVREPEQLSIDKQLMLARYDRVVSDKQNAARCK